MMEEYLNQQIQEQHGQIKVPDYRLWSFMVCPPLKPHQQSVLEVRRITEQIYIMPEPGPMFKEVMQCLHKLIILMQITCMRSFLMEILPFQQMVETVGTILPLMVKQELG